MDRATVNDMDLSGKTVLVRVDFNVPLDGRTITDDTRIVKTLPTIKALIDQGCRTILCAHLGRPEGERNLEYSLQPCATHLSGLIDQDVRFVEDCIGAPVQEAVDEMEPGDVILLENTRFHPGEKSKDQDELMKFAEQLAAPAEAYVNDAFGACHRKHASTWGVTKFLSPCVMGLLVEEELLQLGRILDAPTEGLVIVLGGAKVEDKIGVIRSLLPRCEQMLIGGAMTYAFFRAQGMEIGASLCTEKGVVEAAELLKDMGDEMDHMALPTDLHALNTENPEEKRYIPSDQIQPGWDALDIGPETRDAYAKVIANARNVFWNGPMGKFEDRPFDEGTLAVARAMGECPGFNVVGGGDSVAAVTENNLEEAIDHISTGGGASLEFLELGRLPAVDVLDSV
ncbi:MAG: phosphoglycerate kinase [Armatimonadota bacterium]